jgi:hypothetical protein
MNWDQAKSAIKAPYWLPYEYHIYRAAALSLVLIFFLRSARKNCKPLYLGMMACALRYHDKTLAELFSVEKAPKGRNETLQDIIDRWLPRT